MEQTYWDINDEEITDLNGLELCPDCERVLPAPELEYRDGGYSELVIYCKCGLVYILK